MKKRSFITIFFLVVLFSGYAENKWNSSLIADSLKWKADAVIRLYSTVYERQAIDKYSKEVHVVITVLNRDGEGVSEMLINYDKNSEVADVDAYLYDSNGLLIKKLKRKDISDYAFNNSFTLFSDNRVKYCNPTSNVFPYTAEFFYRVEYKGVVGFNSWFPNEGYDIATENAELIFRTPEQLDIKYKALNHQFEFETKTDDQVRQYRWSASNLTAVPKERQSPGTFDLLPCVLLSPDDISYEGTSGNFSSWKSYGSWVYKLIKGRDQLSEETQKEMKQLTDSIPDERDKIKAVYQYMQGKTRYVNIALGLGGFQPISAADVDEKGYGDCKALSNYTKALLKAIGIKAYYTEIGNGSNQQLKFPEFPSANQTNHVILCVPIENDTVWLECTSQNMPFAYLGGGNSDRYALLITENGGKLVRTPEYKAQDNLRALKMNVDLDSDGNAIIQIKSEFKNYLYEDLFYPMIKSKKEQKDFFLKTLTADGLEINDFSIEDDSEKEVSAVFHMNGWITKYAVKSGNRLFVSPNYLFRNSYPTHIPDSRTQNLFQSLGYLYKDSIDISIPENYSVEFIPKSFESSSVYGTCKKTYNHLDDNIVRVTRFVQINPGNYEKASFEVINSFLKQISKNEKIVLTNKKI